MSDSNKEAVRRQFGPNAAGYAVSQVHAKGGDLALLPGLCGLTGKEEVLDVATATGHTAFALAPFAARVVGVDLTPEMLAEARKNSAHANVSFVEGDAEALPFADGAAVAAEVRRRFAEAPPGAREAFAITATNFTYPKATLRGWSGTGE